jgi:single-strand DNA-binding protein
MNKIILEGNVGNDPEFKTFDNGNTVVNFSLATNESYKNKNGEKVTETEWHRLVVWGNLTQVFKDHVKKGTSILVEGKVKTRSYDTTYGTKRYVTEVFVSWFKFTGSTPVVPRDIQEDTQVDDSDLPFIITLLISSSFLLQSLPF